MPHYGDCRHESVGKKLGSGGHKIGNAHLKWAFSEAVCLLFCLGNSRVRASGRTPKHPHHAVAGLVVRLLEFEFDRHNLDLEANPL